MDLTSIPIMSALKKRLSWLNNNQAVISQNIANADTPGYRAKQLEKQDFSALVNNMNKDSAPVVSGTTMRTSDARHMDAAGGSAGSGAGLKDAEKGEESLNGNSVVLEEEMMKLADNQMKYSMVINLYKKNMGLLKTAMGKGAAGR